MNKNQSLKEKWIADAAYYKSLGRNIQQGQDYQDWMEAEKEYKQLMEKRVKSGLVMIN